MFGEQKETNSSMLLSSDKTMRLGEETMQVTTNVTSSVLSALNQLKKRRSMEKSLIKPIVTTNSPQATLFKHFFRFS